MTPTTIDFELKARKTAAPPPSVRAQTNKPQPQALARVVEKDFVQAVAAWLEGRDWPYDAASFRPYHGINVRLRERGDRLVCGDVPVVQRSPAALLELPAGTLTSNRKEARGLCAVAIRGDAGRYR